MELGRTWQYSEFFCISVITKWFIHISDSDLTTFKICIVPFIFNMSSFSQLVRSPGMLFHHTLSTLVLFGHTNVNQRSPSQIIAGQTTQSKYLIKDILHKWGKKLCFYTLKLNIFKMLIFLLTLTYILLNVLNKFYKISKNYFKFCSTF